MNLNDYLTTAEAAEDLGITKGYFAVIAKEHNWQYTTAKGSRAHYWRKTDVQSFVTESATLLERTYSTATLCQLLGVCNSRIQAIAKHHRVIQVQWSRWLKDDWRPILEKRGISDE